MMRHNKKDRYTPTMNVSSQMEIWKKPHEHNSNMGMEMSTETRKIVSKKALVKKVPILNDDALQPGGALARRLNYDKPHCKIPVTCSILACQLFLWASGGNII